MKILSFEAEGFRNLQSIKFAPYEGVNVIYGDNGQGKTNLLEAIWLFTGMKSFRGAKDRDFIGFDKQVAVISTAFQTAERAQTARLQLQKANIRDKRAFLNGVELDNSAQLFGALRCVVFSPEHLSLVKDGPEERRRFLDGAVAQIRPAYVKLLRQYGKILAQRNSLLKELYRHRDLLPTLDAWDQQLARIGTTLSIMRMEYVEKLSKVCAEYYTGISSGREQLTVRYLSTVFGEPKESISYTNSIIEIYYNKLHAHLDEDIRQGFTGVGVHRDDLQFCIGCHSAKSFGSQGQQRSTVLSLKLAESYLLRHAFGETPCVLFDDVMSELDIGRQSFLMNNLGDMQVFITCCDPTGLFRMENGGRFLMKEGEIAESKKGNSGW